MLRKTTSAGEGVVGSGGGCFMFIFDDDISVKRFHSPSWINLKKTIFTEKLFFRVFKHAVSFSSVQQPKNESINNEKIICHILSHFLASLRIHRRSYILLNIVYLKTCAGLDFHHSYFFKQFSVFRDDLALIARSF